MGLVVAIGSSVHNLKVGDRVVVPFTIACGNCYYCKRQLWSLCDNSNPKAVMAEKVNGYSGSALFGYSHMYGGYAGGQAEYVRVPFADIGPIKVPDGIEDEKVLFLSDILPTGYMAALNCNIQQGDTIAVWGCGPVGLMTIKAAFLLGAERVIAIDHIPSRLKMAQEACGAEALNFEKTNILESLKEMTGGRGPDACVDAVGLEDHGCGFASYYDRFKMAVGLATDRPQVLRQCLLACRKGGTVSIPGVYGGLLDNMPFGAAFAKGLTLRMGQPHVHAYLPKLLRHIEKNEIDTSFVITQRIGLNAAENAYHNFNDNKNEWIKVVMKVA